MARDPSKIPKDIRELIRVGIEAGETDIQIAKRLADLGHPRFERRWVGAVRRSITDFPIAPPPLASVGSAPAPLVGRPLEASRIPQKRSKEDREAERFKKLLNEALTVEDEVKCIVELAKSKQPGAAKWALERIAEIRGRGKDTPPPSDPIPLFILPPGPGVSWEPPGQAGAFSQITPWRQSESRQDSCSEEGGGQESSIVSPFQSVGASQAQDSDVEEGGQPADCENGQCLPSLAEAGSQG